MQAKKNKDSGPSLWQMACEAARGSDSESEEEDEPPTKGRRSGDTVLKSRLAASLAAPSARGGGARHWLSIGGLLALALVVAGLAVAWQFAAMRGIVDEGYAFWEG